MLAQAVVIARDVIDEPIPASYNGQHVTVLQSRERSQFLVELQDGNCYWVDSSQLAPPIGATIPYADEPASSATDSHG